MFTGGGIFAPFHKVEDKILPTAHCLLCETSYPANSCSLHKGSVTIAAAQRRFWDTVLPITIQQNDACASVPDDSDEELI
jgi:hypothetical protein